MANDKRSPLKMNQNPILGALLEPRTSDPSGLIEGQVWFRSDLDQLRIATSSSTFITFRRSDVTLVNADIDAAAGIALSKLAVDPLARANHTGTQLASTISNFDTQVRTSRLDQMAAPTSAVSMNSQKITGLADGTSSNDAASWGQVQALVQGLKVKASVRVATTANLAPTSPTTQTLPLGGTTLTVDGVAVANGDRILVKNQTTSSQNGIYVVSGIGSSVLLTRTSDADTWDELAAAFVFIEQGSGALAETGWVSTTNTGGGTLGTNGITFTQFAGYGTILDGAGLSLVGNTMDVNIDGVTTEIVSDQVRVKDLGITAAKIANATITDTQIAAANKDGVAGTASMRTLGTGAQQALAGTHAAATGLGAHIPSGGITHSEVAAANKDGVAGTASMRTLGTGAQQAAAGNHTHVAADVTNFDTQVRTNRLDQMAAPTADVNLNSRKITSLATPTAATDAANKSYVDGVVQGLDIKTAARAATTGAETFTIASGSVTQIAGTTVDGVPLVNGDRVLIKDAPASTGAGSPGSSAIPNGVYVVTNAGANLTVARASDADASDMSETRGGMFIFITAGTTNADSGWVESSRVGPWQPAVDTNQWTQFSGAGQVVAGNGLTKTGNTLNVGAGAGITVGADTVAIDTSVVGRIWRGTFTGDGTTTTFTIVHNLSSGIYKSYNVEVISAADGSIGSGDGPIDVDWKLFTDDSIRFYFGIAPASGEQFSVIVVG